MTVERYFIDEAKKAHKIESFLRKELDTGGFSHCDVKKTPLGTRIIIYALRPGLVIGSGGSNIKKVTQYVKSKFKLENPHLEVEQVEEPFLDPHIVAWKIARALERGVYFKKIAYIMLSKIMEAGAKGAEIRLGGKLPSARSRTWIFVDGNLRKCGQESIDDVKTAYMKALTQPGIIGVTVSILPPGLKFSDEITKKKVPTVKSDERREVETVKTPEELSEEESSEEEEKPKKVDKKTKKPKKKSKKKSKKAEKKPTKKKSKKAEEKPTKKKSKKAEKKPTKKKSKKSKKKEKTKKSKKKKTKKSKDFDSMTKKEIYKIAQEKDVSGRSTMSKAELIDAVKKA